ncbi:hypothetical protein F2Q70_00038571 [Brassica cretica]|uniref:Uncharacterized protein n=1 Tax=Brassica cretica TaxID=69181 RepID=A0A8S9KDQ7_BRACR|nr:hypothetical protein F2Q70_00038571 [Brassica cretica]
MVVRGNSNSLNGSEGRDRPPKKAKVTGTDHRPGVSGNNVVAKRFHWQFSHSKVCPITEDPYSVAHLVRHFKPAGCLNPSLRNMTGRDAYVKMVVAHAKEKWEKKKAETDCEARLKEVMANINLLKEIMNNNLLASDELLRLRAKEVELGSELDVMAVSDFSVGRLDLPQISENLHEEFFAKVPSEVNEPGNKAKCAGGQFEDGKFDAEE